MTGGQQVRVGLVLVSHSGNLAKGLTEVAKQMAPDVTVLPAGGTDNDRIGTSFERIEAMVTDVIDSGQAALVLSDLGSATMTAETVLETVDGPAALVDAPFVEGAVAAAVAAQGGASLEEARAAAEAAIEAFARPQQTGPPQQETGPQQQTGPQQSGDEHPAAGPAPGELSRTLVLKNKLGLHARPAAMVARTAAEHDARVTVNGADAASVLALMGLALPGGAEVELRASGPAAQAAMAALVPQFEEGFGEE